MNSGNVYVLYYSNYCKFCNKFRQELAKTRYSKLFRLQLIDPDPRTKLKPPLPPGLKQVPTIFVKENNSSKFYAGKDAFMWVAGNLDSKGNALKPQNRPSVNLDSTGLMTYDQELSGDNSYSLIDGTDTLSGGYGLLNQEQQINTPQESTSTNFKNMQNSYTNSQMNSTNSQMNSTNSQMNNSGLNNSGLNNSQMNSHEGFGGNSQGTLPGTNIKTNMNQKNEEVKASFDNMLAQREAEMRNIPPRRI